MTTAIGQLKTYSATEPHKRAVTDRIIMKEPDAIVAISALGLSNEGKFAFVNTPGTKYEWLEDQFAGQVDAINGAELTTDTTLTVFTVDAGALFQVGDVIRVDAELMWVASVATHVLNVTRGYAGTQATHADGAAVTVVGRQRLEGAAAGDGAYTEPSTGVNYSSIFQKTIEISRSNALLQNYGISNVVDREIDKVMDENMRILNRSMYTGAVKAGSATTPRGAGGLDDFISTNKVASAGAALTRKNIEDELALAWAAGGEPDLILCDGWGKRKIASFYEGFVRTERSESVGGVTIDVVTMPLGMSVMVAADRFCPAGYMFIVDRNFAGGITLDPFFYEELGKSKDTADGGYGQVVGEYGFVCAFETAHAKITGYSVTV